MMKKPISKNGSDDWCPIENVTVHAVNGKRPNKIRCPNCRKRLTPQTINSEPFDPEFKPIYRIPPHKVPHGKR